MNVRLEYSAIKGEFREVHIKDLHNPAHDYKMIICFINQQKAARFIDYVTGKYPELLIRHNSSYPSAILMETEICDFITDEWNAVKTSMSHEHSRRTSILTQTKGL